ncbi:NAD(P)H-binding protein [Corynebacterium belfantii]|uniref:NAD(P)H-binding protein n=1 Tax=Corynebacterium belfantii TaxID=2014537 RepID=UPI002285589E|nr:NAD(P)H-binding protein [Corynebacterium belfantii]
MNSTITPTLNLKARHAERRVVVTGALGYVGARLAVELLSAGFNVRATSRSLSSLKHFPWYDQAEAVEADLSVSEDVNRLFENVDTVFYLVHSMGGTQNFEELESKIASKVAQSAHSNGVRQIIYLLVCTPAQSSINYPHICVHGKTLLVFSVPPLYLLSRSAPLR